MVVNTKLTIEGTNYPDTMNINVDKNIGDYNATSNFTVEFNNDNGKYNAEFSLNDEVIIYADIDTQPPTTKIFTGIIEDISYSGTAGNERIKLAGRDYGAVLQDMTIQPSIFKDRDAGEIAKIIIAQNTGGIVTNNNVDTTTGTTIERMPFNHKNIFDALKELAELSGYYFYVDSDKDVHFEAKGDIPSGLTFDNTNVTKGNFKINDKEIYNKVWVYGDRILTGNSQYLEADGTGSVFTLTDKPHNTRVFISGTIPTLIQPGGVFEMDDPATKDVKWLLNFNEKNVIFTSGDVAGDNIPVAGSVFFEYERSTPILKFKQDDSSITSYGPKTEVIIDRGIKDFSFADQRATSFLADNKDPKIQGNLDIKGVIDITPGNTAVVNLPWYNIILQPYTILSASYSFNKKNNLSENVLHLTLNKKISDFTDTLKKQILRIDDFEAGPLEGTLTRLETATNYADVDNHYELWAKDINSNFVFHSDKHGLLESPDSRLGTGVLGSTFITSGGGF